MAIFTGTSGDDSIEGTSSGDDFHLEQGGEDFAQGNAGIDVFYMGASFDAGDQIRGGDGKDFILLEGDYSAGVAFAATTLVKIDEMDLATGFSYAFSNFTDANDKDGLRVDGSALGAGDSLDFDASALAAGVVTLIGGAGDDVLKGGGGGDQILGGEGDQTLGGGDGKDFITFGSGVNVVDGGGGDDQLFAQGTFNPNNVIEGGDGKDTLFMGGKFNLAALSIDGVERISSNGLDLSLTLKNSVLEQHRLSVTAADAQADLVVNGSKITDGVLILSGGDGDDKLRGGSGDDTISGGHGAHNVLVGGDGDDVISDKSGVNVLKGGGGDDLLSAGYYSSGTLSGGDGNDVLTGGGGAYTMLGGDGDDVIRFLPNAMSNADLLDGGAGNDTIDVASPHSIVFGGDGDDMITVYPFASFETITGGLGADTINMFQHDTLVYESVADSTAAAPDLLHGSLSTETIDLSAVDADTIQAGDQAFTLVEAFTGHAGELEVVYDSFRDVTNIEADVDGDGAADLLIVSDGDATGFSGFVL